MTVLSICIPIWNSVREVDRTISAINELLLLNSNLLEIVISDNHSDDGTWERLVESNLGSEPKVRVCRQGSNLGFRGNLLALSQMSNSQFIWFLGAGERIHTTKLMAVIKFLESSQPAVLVLKGEIASSQMVEVHQKVEEAIHFEELDAGYPYSETISMNVFKTTDVLSCLTAPKSLKVLDNSWPHLEIASSAWSNGPVFFQKGGPVVEISPNPHGWWFHASSAFEIYTDKLLLGLDNQRISNSREFVRLAGVGAAFHAFEVRTNGVPQGRQSFLRFRELVSLRWRWVVDMIYFSPKWLLLLVQRLKRTASRLLGSQ
jgi:glycosyltransferase involved in cell wall biosynthesis